MANTIFENTGALLLPTNQGTAQAATALQIGGDLFSGAMIDLSGGKQNARLQVEAAVTGDLYVLGCTGGIGSYSMTFMDGPYEKCSGVGETNLSVPDPIMKKYIAMKDVKSRKATVYIYNGFDTSKLLGKFVGVLNNMATAIISEGNAVYLRVTVDMLGSWQE